MLRSDSVDGLAGRRGARVSYLDWGSWLDLFEPATTRAAPAASGLYKVRMTGDSQLVYVGQSSGLRGRLSQLVCLYRDVIPYNDPQTAAPCLWVMRTEEDTTFEVSVAEMQADAPGRKASECVVVSEHRERFGC